MTPHQRNHPDFTLRRFVACGACGPPLTRRASQWLLDPPELDGANVSREAHDVKRRRQHLGDQRSPLRALFGLQPGTSEGASRSFWQDVRNAPFHGWTDAYTLINGGF